MIVVPARKVETDMRKDVETAKLAGFPQLPPEFATPEDISAFIYEWNLIGPDEPSRQEIEELSLRAGKYRDDSALFNLGIVASLIGLVILSATAFTRALNNLYALGHELSSLSPAWVLGSWFIPLLSFVLPWRAVKEVVTRTWQTGSVADRDERARGARWTGIVTGLWARRTSDYGC